MKYSKKSIIWSAITLIIAMIVISCASLSDNDVDQTVVKISIQFATMRTIEESDSITAERVVEVVADVRQVLSGNDTIALSLLTEVINDQINWDSLEPSEKLLVNTLISVALSHVQSLNLVPEEILIQVDQVLSWIEEAAGFANSMS